MSDPTTLSFTVTVPATDSAKAPRVYEVDIYCRDTNAPHGWEATMPQNDDYYTSGMLIIESGELVDYDGVAELPMCVTLVLRALGWTVDPIMYTENEATLERFRRATVTSGGRII